MECHAHPGIEAVGNCVSCGRPICPSCTVRMDNIMHCRECVEGGRVQVAPATPQAYPPVQPYPYPGTGDLTYMPMSPRGPPDTSLIGQASFGSLLAMIFLIPGIIWSLMYIGDFIFRGFDVLYIDDIGAVFIVLYIVALFMQLLFARGLQGLSWNYGDLKIASPVPFFYIGVLITVIIELVYLVADLLDWNAFYGSGSSYFFSASGLLSIVSGIPMAIAYVFTFSALKSVCMYLPPNSPMRDNIKFTSYLFLGAGIVMAISILLNFFPLDGILLIVAYYNMWRFFANAPMPQAPTNPTATIPPLTNP